MKIIQVHKFFKRQSQYLAVALRPRAGKFVARKRIRRNARSLQDKLGLGEENIEVVQGAVVLRKPAELFAQILLTIKFVLDMQLLRVEIFLAQEVAIQKQRAGSTAKKIHRVAGLLVTEGIITLRKCAEKPQIVRGQTMLVNAQVMEGQLKAAKKRRNMQIFAEKILRNADPGNLAHSKIRNKEKNMKSIAGKILINADLIVRIHQVAIKALILKASV
ncbi:MAG: hypothetical protein HYW63_04475 [Candidatus Levybacteria bacterium]|nr:hypothetical protein [Candidatus Levybacteria bacterium]